MIMVEEETVGKEVIMPRGDKTGPDGMGQLTGRRLGYCAGYDTPGFTKGSYGMGRRFGRGGGRGKGREYAYAQPVYYNQPTAEPVFQNVSEKTILENEIRILKEQLSNMEKRLTEIQKEKE